MQPLGRKKLRFPGKVDHHPPKGWMNWWEDHSPSKGGERQRQKRGLRERVTDLLEDRSSS